MFIVYLFTHFYMKSVITNLLFAVIVLVVLVWGVSIWLNAYTNRNESVEIPNVKSMKMEVARPLFEACELSCQVVDSTSNKAFSPGTIIETIPPVGSKVKKGRTVYIRLNSCSAGKIAIPDVRDLSQRQATAMLKTLGLGKIEIEWVPGKYRDLVVGVEYRGRLLQIKDQVPVNAVITLLVSSGTTANEQDDILIPDEGILENSDNPFDF